MDVNIFVQLFVINRFLKSKKEHETFLTLATENNVSNTIVTRLSESGLTWIKDTSFDDTQVNSVHQMFNFIVNKHPAIYENTISTKIDANKYPFSGKVLNQSDIVTSIFQHLYLSDITNCSLVESGFLYHSFHGNSLFYFITSWIKLFPTDKRRIWERFLNARKVGFFEFTDNRHKNCEAPDIFWQAFCLMKNMEQIHIRVKDYFGALLKVVKIVSQSSIANRLRVFESCVNTQHYEMNRVQDNSKTKRKISKTDVQYYISNYSDVEKVPVNVVAGFELLLLNCQDVRIRDSLFSIVISKKCHTLSLGSKCNINYSYKSSDNGIKCDMSGIRNLALKNTTFFQKENIIVNNDDGEDLKLVTVNNKEIISMAKQCVNVENFVIGALTSHNVLFWKTLQLNEIKKLKQNNNKKDLFIFLNPSPTIDYNVEQMVEYILQNDLWMNRFYVSSLSRQQLKTLKSLFKQGLQKQLKDKLEIFVLNVCYFARHETYSQLWDFWDIDIVKNKNKNKNKIAKPWYEELNALKWLGSLSGHKCQDFELLNGILAVFEHLNANKKGNMIGTQMSMCVLISNIANLESMDQLLSTIKKLMIARVPLMINIMFEPRRGRHQDAHPPDVNKFKDVYHKLFLPKFENKEKKKEHDNNEDIPNWYEKPLWDDQDRFYQTRASPIILFKINDMAVTKVDLDKIPSLEKVELIVKTAEKKNGMILESIYFDE